MILGDLILWVDSMNTFYHGITKAQNVGPVGAREKHQLKLSCYKKDMAHKTQMICPRSHQESEAENSAQDPEGSILSALQSITHHPWDAESTKIYKPNPLRFLGIRKRKKSLLHHAQSQ